MAIVGEMDYVKSLVVKRFGIGDDRGNEEQRSDGTGDEGRRRGIENNLFATRVKSKLKKQKWEENDRKWAEDFIPYLFSSNFDSIIYFPLLFSDFFLLKFKRKKTVLFYANMFFCFSFFFYLYIQKNFVNDLFITAISVILLLSPLYKH